MPTKTYNIRINQEDHDKALKVFNELGLDLSSGIKIYLRQVIKLKGIPFSLSTQSSDDIPNAETMKAIIKAHAEEEGLIPDTAKTFTNSKDAIDFLNSNKRNKN